MALPQDGQNANALATVKEVPIGKKLIFVDPDTNEGGIITLEDLTTQILKKLTSQTFALDQGTKTLPAALNELNSNLTKLSEIKVSSTSYDVPQRTEQTFTPMELSAGTWLIIGHCGSNAPNAGIYNFCINSRMVRANNQNGGGCINAMLIVFDKETSVPLSLYQDAATTLKMKVYLQAIRIG